MDNIITKVVTDKKIEEISILYTDGSTESIHKGVVASIEFETDDKVMVDYFFHNMKGKDLKAIVDTMFQLASKLGLIDELLEEYKTEETANKNGI